MASRGRAGSAAFQRDLERRYSSAPRSPFAAVASHYLEAGSSATVVFQDDKLEVRVGEHPAPVGQRLHFAFDGKMRCTAGCEGAPVIIERSRPFPLARFIVLAAPQSRAGRLIVYDPQVLTTRGAAGLRWFPVDERYLRPSRFTVREPPEAVTLTTSRGLRKDAWIVGTFAFVAPEDGSKAQLVGYTFGDLTGETLDVLIPFSDATTHKETYGAGRYLEFSLTKGVDEVWLDFNRAFNPLCAYSPHFNCPLPPKSNRLSFAVRAGEMIHHAH